MLSTLQLKSHIEKFVALQVLLTDAFRAQFPSARDWENLLDFPKRGQVSTPDGVWEFHMHGCGLMFVDAGGVTIDVHDRVAAAEMIDAWRLLQFLESIGAVTEDDIDVAGMNRRLEKLKEEGFVSCVDKRSGKYRK